MTQLELLRASLARLEPVHGSGNPYVQGLRAQMARRERDAWRRANGGWWGPAAGWLQQPTGEGQPLGAQQQPNDLLVEAQARRLL